MDSYKLLEIEGNEENPSAEGQQASTPFRQNCFYIISGRERVSPGQSLHMGRNFHTRRFKIHVPGVTEQGWFA